MGFKCLKTQVLLTYLPYQEFIGQRIMINSHSSLVVTINLETDDGTYHVQNPDESHDAKPLA